MFQWAEPVCAEPQAANVSPSQGQGVVWLCIVILRNLSYGLSFECWPSNSAFINFLVLTCGKDTGILFP